MTPFPHKKRSSPNAVSMCLYYLGREMGMMVADEIKVADQPTLNRWSRAIWIGSV